MDGSAAGLLAGEPVRLLVVDDQESFRIALRELVAATEGFDLAGEAASGEAALDAVDELSAEMVIMDKRMPGMGGVEATRLITARHPGVVVILISLEAPDDRLTQSCGAAAFVHKQELSPRRLQEMWERHGSARTPRVA